MTRRSQADIEQLLQAYRERGDLTRHAFCEKQGISLSTIDYYLRRYGKLAKPQVRMARVKLEPAEAPNRFALILGNRRRIECGEAGLTQLIRAAEAM
jgi:hypothetical protein